MLCLSLPGCFTLISPTSLPSSSHTRYIQVTQLEISPWDLSAQIPQLTESEHSFFYSFFFFFFFFFFCFLGLQLQHMEVSRLGVELELQLPHESQATSVTYTTAHGNCWILSPLSKAKDQTQILTDTGWACYH